MSIRQMSVDEALEDMRNTPGAFDPARKIQMVKELRARTGLELREAMWAVSEAITEEDIDLGSILADLRRREGRDVASAEREPNGHGNGHVATGADLIAKAQRDRELKHERDRRYTARRRERLELTRPPVRPATEEIAWRLVGTIETPVLQGLLSACGLTLELVAKNGKRPDK